MLTRFMVVNISQDTHISKQYVVRLKLTCVMSIISQQNVQMNHKEDAVRYHRRVVSREWDHPIQNKTSLWLLCVKWTVDVGWEWWQEWMLEV